MAETVGSPSSTHEGLLLLFKNQPELAPALLRDALGVALPRYAEARIDSPDLTAFQPAEYRADLVVLLQDGRPVLGIVVEVQLELRPDDRKRYTWPVYVAQLRARLECQVCLLVVTPTESVAARAREAIPLGPGSLVTPLVVGPTVVPIVRDVEAAVRSPELAVLSAMAHGRGPPEVAVPIAVATLEACRGLDEERALLYFDLLGVSLGDAARIAFEELMSRGTYEYQSDFAKRHRAAGEAVGRAAGEAAGKSASVLQVLEARGVVVSAEERGRILACSDVATLDAWIRRAVTATSVDALFAADG